MRLIMKILIIKWLNKCKDMKDSLKQAYRDKLCLIKNKK